MAVIYLRHPKFGTKVATLDAEAAYDVENGWEEFDPVAELAEAAEPEELAEVEQAEVEPVANELQPKRRGRPPRQEAA